MLALISICLDLSFPSVVQKVVTWDSLSARQPSISIPALFKTYSDSLHNPSTQVSLNSFQEPPRYGNKKSRAQGLSLSLIALSLSFFICNIGIIISTMPNSPDCVRVEQNEASECTLQTTSAKLLCKCGYFYDGALIQPTLFHDTLHTALQLDHSMLGSLPSLSWGSGQSPREQIRRPGCPGSGW